MRGSLRAAIAQTVLDQLVDAAVVVDRDLKPIAWNARYLQQLGLRQQQFMRRLESASPRCCDLLRLEVCREGCLAQRVLTQRKPVRVDEIAGWVETMPDDKMTFIVNASPVVDEQGEIVGTLEVYRDVTGEARIQARYKALLEEERKRSVSLEEQVRLRTEQLQQSINQLEQTRDRLIQAEKLSSLGQLVAGVAHEINNPTSFIYGNMRFLSEHATALLKMLDFATAEANLAPTAREELHRLMTELEIDYVRDDLFKIIDAISTGAERITAIVRDLRRYVHNGSADERATVDLARCLDMALSFFKFEIRGIHGLERAFDPATPKVVGNEGQLSQVVINLVANSVHAVGPEGRIRVELRPHDNGACIVVQDNGAGIPEEHLLKVFDPFFTTKPVGEGTGMGLAIAHSIVDRHGGTIGVTSKVGAGTTFTVWLPAAP
ncbi:MAG: ATP-binding protein [Myxococcota bacterium]